MTELESTDPGVDPALVLHLAEGAPVSAAGGAVRAVAEGAGVAAERATQLRVLIEQLLNEARAREAVTGADVLEVRVVHDGLRLRVEILDERIPPLPGAGSTATSRRLAALGFVDSLHLERRGAAGNRAVATVGLGADSDLHHTEQVLGEEPPVVSDDALAGLIIRRMEPADALGVARCVYRCYGYSYLHPMMYQPDQLRRALRSGVMHSVVAVAASGEIVGHCALSFNHPGDPVPEAGKMVVDPRYRGHHLAERLSTERRDAAAALGLEGMWSACVTNHPFSQRELRAAGGAETGVLLAAAAPVAHMEGIADDRTGRAALMAMFVPVVDPGERVVHLPERLAAAIAPIAARLGLRRSIVTDAPSASASASSTSSLSVAADVESGLAAIRVVSSGDDLIDAIGDALDEVDAFELGAAHLDIPLADPTAIAAASAAESAGFSFAAWLPGYDESGDVLRMQRVLAHRPDLESIACAGPEGEELRDFVIAEYHRVRPQH